MSRTRRYRGQGASQRRRAFGRTRQETASRWQRAQCCGATIAADPARMAGRWADVHEAGCGVPWQLLGLPGEPREVYPGAPGVPDGIWLPAVNRKAGRPPANPRHAAAVRSPR
jgi:hypothetical protein